MRRITFSLSALALTLPMMAAQDDCTVHIVIDDSGASAEEKPDGDPGDKGDDNDGDKDDPDVCEGCEDEWIDSDGDGLSDLDEAYEFGTDPYNPDTDFDGIPDGEDEDTWCPDCNPENGEFSDSDGDGLSDADEESIGTDPYNYDTDGDLLTDLDELFLGTDPLNPDTDGDGVLDSEDPDAGAGPDGDQQGFEDDDGDGLCNKDEREFFCTDPENADTDGDGLLDSEDEDSFCSDQ